MPGGEQPFLQQQYWPLKQLAERPAPAPAPAPVPPTPRPVETLSADPSTTFAAVLHRKAIASGLFSPTELAA